MSTHQQYTNELFHRFEEMRRNEQLAKAINQKAHDMQMEKLTREAEENNNVSAMKQLAEIYEKDHNYSLAFEHSQDLSKAYHYHRMVLQALTRLRPQMKPTALASLMPTALTAAPAHMVDNSLNCGTEHLAFAQFISRNRNQLHQIKSDSKSYLALRREGFRSFYFALEICHPSPIKDLNGQESKHLATHFADLCTPGEMIKEIKTLLRAYRSTTTTAPAMFVYHSMNSTSNGADVGPRILTVKMSIKNIDLILSIFQSINNKYGYSKYAEEMLDILRCYTSQDNYIFYLRSILKFANDTSIKVIIADVMHWNTIDDELLKILLIKAKSNRALTSVQSIVKEIDINRRNLQEIKWMFTTGQLDDQEHCSASSTIDNKSQLQSLKPSRCILPVSLLQNIGSFLPWFASTKVDEWRLKLFVLTVKLSKKEFNPQ